MSEEVQAVEVPSRRTVVSSENATEFYAEKLGLAAEAPSEAEEQTSEPEVEAEAEVTVVTLRGVTTGESVTLSCFSRHLRIRLAPGESGFPSCGVNSRYRS